MFWLGYEAEVRVKFSRNDSGSIDSTFIGALLSQRLGSGENSKDVSYFDVGENIFQAT